MAARQIIVPGAMPSRDANGRSLPARLRFYQPGTVLPKTVYTTSALTTAHPFPLTSDSAGRWPQIWAEESEYFDVAWSRRDTDALIASFDDIRPLSDAVFASADIAAMQAGLAQAAAEAAAGFAEDAETAAATTDGVLDQAESLRDQTQELRDQTQALRNQAQEIVGFDPTGYVNTALPQSFSDGEKAQARANIGAAPTHEPAFTGAAEFGGAVEIAGALDAQGGASIAGGASVAGGLEVAGGVKLTGVVSGNVETVSGTELDLSSAGWFKKAISTNTTFTFANLPPEDGIGFVVELTISSGAVDTWPASVEYAGGTKPTLGNGRHVLGFVTFDHGAKWTMSVGSKAAAPL